MKIFIRIVQIITALILIFFSIGMFIEEVRYDTEVSVKADKDEAFVIFANPKLTSEWLEGFIKFEPVKGEPMTEGSQWKLFIAHNGQVYEMLETVNTIIPGEQFSFTIENDMATTEVDIFFQQQGEETIIQSKNITKGNGLFWRSLMPLFKGSMQEESMKSYEKLVKVIEREVGR